MWNTWLDEVGKLRHIDPATLSQQIDALPTEIPAANGDIACKEQGFSGEAVRR